ncbi:MAG TPA: hypothetical protein VHR66_18690 [Gemmataceae bacterium]|jgi:hypothetical protein|nr:hypothetical protein [Gemmataceae bacterium]
MKVLQTKRAAKILAITSCLAVALALLAVCLLQSRATVTRELYERIQPGMTELEIDGIIGFRGEIDGGSLARMLRNSQDEQAAQYTWKYWRQGDSEIAIAFDSQGRLTWKVWTQGEISPDEAYYSVGLKYDENGAPIERSGGGRGRERGLCESIFAGLKEFVGW